MPTTTKGFPYPSNSDNVDIPGDMQALAEAIDTFLPGGTYVDTTSRQTLENKELESVRELVTVSATAATGTINVDAMTSGILYYTSNASANFTLNFRGDSGTTLATHLDTGDAISLTFINTNGATAYRPTAFQIDGSSVTPKWQGGTAPTSGNANSNDVYAFTIIKTAATPTYIVLASQTRFA